MKAVLISIHPKWCELIANGEKTMEVRKTRPKIETPFKCYIYQTKAKQVEHCYGCDITYYGNGKVIGEFVCDRIEKIEHFFEYYSDGYDLDDDKLQETCLTREELKYYGKGGMLYGWHISDLKIYDKPKELGEFFVKGDCENFDFCYRCKYYYRGDAFSEAAGIESGCTLYDDLKSLSRPPQSWCYVEE